MKKFLLAALAATTLVACGKTEKIYVVDSLPENLQTTEAPDTTAPKPTTTVRVTAAPNNYYSYSEQNFIDQVYSFYGSEIYLTDDDLLDIAYTICDTLNTGVSLEAVIAVVAANLPATDDMARFASAIMASGILNLCPQHKWQIPE